MNAEVREFLQFAKRNGFQCIRSSKHVVLSNESGVHMTIPSTPSDRRSMKNAKAQLRRLLKSALKTASQPVLVSLP